MAGRLLSYDTKLNMRDQAGPKGGLLPWSSFWKEPTGAATNYASFYYSSSSLNISIYREREERGTFLIMKIETKCIIPSINCSSIQFIFLIFSIWNLQNSCHFASSRARPICKVPPTSTFSSFSEIKITHWRTRLDSENYTTISLPLRLSQKTPHH